MSHDTDLLNHKFKVKHKLHHLLSSNWKWSLLMIRPDTLVMTIIAAPIDLVGERIDGKEPKQDVLEIDTNNLQKQYEGATLFALNKIVDVLNGASTCCAVRSEIRIGTVQTPFKVIK